MAVSRPRWLLRWSRGAPPTHRSAIGDGCGRFAFERDGSRISWWSVLESFAEGCVTFGGAALASDMLARAVAEILHDATEGQGEGVMKFRFHGMCHSIFVWAVGPSRRNKNLYSKIGAAIS